MFKDWTKTKGYLSKVQLVILIILLVSGCVQQNCSAAMVWAKNDATGQCRYFSSSCAVEEEYSGVNLMDCDCDNLEPHNLEYAIPDCKGNQELYNN